MLSEEIVAFIDKDVAVTTFKDGQFIGHLSNEVSGFDAASGHPEIELFTGKMYVSIKFSDIKKIEELAQLNEPLKMVHCSTQEKAIYKVYDEYGEIREVEIHWYQHPDVGRVEEKVKAKNGHVYIDEWY